MHRTCYALLLGLAFLSTLRFAHAQPSTPRLIDSLQQALPTVEDPEKRWGVLVTLSGLTTPLDGDTALYYAHEAYAIAVDLEDTEKQGEAILRIAPVYMQRGMYSASDSILAVAKPLVSQTTDLKLLSVYHHTVGTNAQYQGRYLEATQGYTKSLEIQETFAEPHELVADYVNLGSLIARRSMLEEGLAYMRKAYRVAQEVGLPLVQIEYNIALGFHGDGQYDSALYYGERALETAVRENSAFGVFKMNELLSDTYIKDGQLEKGYEAGMKALDFARNANHRVGMHTNLLNVAFARALQDRPQEAMVYYEEAAAMGITDGRKRRILGTIYERMGQYDKALEQFHVFYEAMDSVQLKTAAVQIAEFERIYNSDRKDREIERLAQAQQIGELQLGRQRLIMGFGAIVFLLVFAIGGVIYQRNRVKQHDQLHNIEQRLLRSQMNPHFIFNALSAIQNFILYQKAQEATRFLSKFGKLIRQTLENSRQEFITLAEEVAMLENYLAVQQMRFDEKFTYSIEIDDSLDPKETKLPPMFTQPFIENSLEHGLFKKEENHIWVRFRPEEGMLVLEVEDTGTGLQARGEESITHQSLATTITQERLEIFRRLFRKAFDLEVTNKTGKDAEVMGALVRLSVPMLAE